MANGNEVLTYLRPNGGWVIYGDDFDSILWHSAEPVTKKEFEDAMKNYDAILETEKTNQNQAKSDLLSKLGITADEAKLLLS